MRVLCLALAALLCGSVSGQVSTTFSSSDAEAAAARAASALAGTDASLSPTDAYFASVVLSHAGQSKSKPAAACADLKATLEAGSAALSDLSYALRAAFNLGCLKKKQYVVNEKVAKAVQAGLESEYLSDIYAAVSALPVLKARGAGLKVDWEPIASAVAGLIESEGTFRSSPSGPASALNAGQAYHILAAAWEAVSGSADASRIRVVINSIGMLLQSADGSEDTSLTLGSGESRLSTSSLVISGALKLATVSGEDVDVQVEQIAAFANGLLIHRFAVNTRHIGEMLIGLRAVASNTVAVPLAVTVATPSLRVGSTDDIVVSVTDVFGKFATKVEITADSVTRAGSSRALGSNMALVPSSQDESNTQYSIDIMSKAPRAGMYTLSMYIRPESETYGTVEEAKRTFSITARMAISDAEIMVVPSSSKKYGKPQPPTTASHPNSAPQVLKAEAEDKLHIVFSTTAEGSDVGVTPHQTFVEFRHTKTGVSTIFVASPEPDSTTGSHRLSLDLSDRKSLHEACEEGRYSIHLYIGDSTIENAISWNIGSVELVPPPAPEAPEEILYSKPLLHQSDTTLKALPEIHHQFREPEARPSSLVSRAATVLVLLPLAFLVLSLLSISGGNFSQFGANGSSLSALIFLVSTGGLLGLIFVYWLRLNMFQFLSYAILPSIVSILSGRQLLRALHLHELKAKQS